MNERVAQCWQFMLGREVSVVSIEIIFDMNDKISMRKFSENYLYGDINTAQSNCRQKYDSVCDITKLSSQFVDRQVSVEIASFCQATLIKRVAR